jgi:hypothetical protein
MPSAVFASRLRFQSGCNCKVGAMTLYLGIDIGLSGALALLVDKI